MRSTGRPRITLLSCSALVGVLLGASTVQQAEAAAPREPLDIDVCVSYDEIDASDSLIEARLRSTCEAKVRCEVSWTLDCKDGRATTQHAKRFTLGPGAEAKTRVSAAVCKNEIWELEELSWSCREL